MMDVSLALLSMVGDRGNILSFSYNVAVLRNRFVFVVNNPSLLNIRLYTSL